MSINTTILVGRLTKDGELSQSKNGNAMFKFTLAVDKGFGKDRETNFIPVIVFKNLAENMAKFTGKGSLVAIEGSIDTASYINSEDKRVYTWNVIAHNVRFLDTKKEAGEKPSDVIFEGKEIQMDDSQLPF